MARDVITTHVLPIVRLIRRLGNINMVYNDVGYSSMTGLNYLKSINVERKRIHNKNTTKLMVTSADGFSVFGQHIPKTFAAYSSPVNLFDDVTRTLRLSIISVYLVVQVYGTLFRILTST